MEIRYVWYKLLIKLKGKGLRNSIVSKDANIGAGSMFVDSKMGRFSYCGYDCFIINTIIGSFCSISDNVSIGGGTHPLSWVSTSPAFYKGRDSISKRLAKLEYDMKDGRTTIGNDVWIGRGVYIKAGVNIGDGAVIGMGSIVTKNVEPYSIVAGNPAIEIRKRFDDRTIEELCNKKWWDKEEDEISSLAYWANDIRKFLENC